MVEEAIDLTLAESYDEITSLVSKESAIEAILIDAKVAEEVYDITMEEVGERVEENLQIGSLQCPDIVFKGHQSFTHLPRVSISYRKVLKIKL